ncbi:MAG TPA: hypothetical protein PKM43_04945 [Verrucomicrobiota bacterium]|nr:hypothetical protein [Verrucomicrobiota bacterium]
MTKLLSFAVPLAAAMSVCGLNVQAAITQVTLSDDPLEVLAQLRIGTGLATYENVGNWTVSVVNTPVQSASPRSILSIFGQHNVAPHAGELAPNPDTFSFQFTLLLGNNFQYAVTQVETQSLSHGDHADQWFALVRPDTQQNVYVLELNGTHPIPEPHQYALMAGLGLLGFGAYRRVRA